MFDINNINILNRMLKAECLFYEKFNVIECKKTS